MPKIFSLLLMGIIVAVISPKFAQAQTLSAAAFYNRCYSQLTGHPVPLNHAVMAQVRSGKLNALVACNNLIEKAVLNPSSGMLSPIDDKESFWILNNFYSFHRSWFPGNTVEQIQNYNDETGLGTRDIYDTTEPGLAITRSVFTTGAKYSDVLTLNTGVHGIRQDNNFIRNLIGWTVSAPGRSVFGNNTAFDGNLFNFRATSGGFDGSPDTTNSLFMVLPKIETGELVGVRTTTESSVIPNVNMSPLGDSTAGNSVPGLNFSFNIFQTLGGGVLGSPSYVLLNFGHELGLPMNGQLKVPRRWAKTTMETFMCSTLPALRESDVAQYFVGKSSSPFRNSTSCLQCHSTLDQMAYTARNVILNSTDFFVINSSDTHPGPKLGFVMSTFKAELASVDGWASEVVPNFHRQAPHGKIYFRTFSHGELINKAVGNISELGSALTQIDDFYQCAAKKYFEFFTGIQVPLYDRGDPTYTEINKALSAESIADRKFIEGLALNLRQSQSIKNLIKEIIASDYYRSSTFRPQGGLLGK